jgi:ketosteroid isomerase-like protein
MSEENVDRFLEGVAAFNRGDVERWLAIYHPDAVVEPQIAAVEGDYSGLDDLRRLFVDMADSWEVFELHFSDLRDLGDRVLALGTFRSIGKESGVEQEISAAFLVTYRDGLCTHMKDYGEWAQALEAAGLRE